MKEIIKIERKRILNKKFLILFFVVLLLFSVNNSYYAVKNYDVLNNTGVVQTWKENLTHGKENTKVKFLKEDYLLSLKNKEESSSYVDETNLEDLVAMNYDGKKVQDLSDKEIKSFYSKRLSNIQEMLDDSSRINYTKSEKEKMMEQAGQLSSPIPMDYAEGWKVLNENMRKFMPLLLVLIALILLPLFGSEPQTKMKDLYRSTRYGKKKLDRARLITAFMVGIVLYLFGVMLYTIVMMTPFGWEGGSQPIQSNAATFFSVYNITYIQQIGINVLIGLLAMIFLIALTLLLTILTEGVMTGAVIIIFFWILLLLFDQIPLYPVNHLFANFMPLRMTDFLHYYTENDIYRIMGNSFTGLSWTALVSAVLSILLLILAVVFSDMKRMKKL
ncbi:hypothetical protein [Anaerosacchariphilus polymeriproducens]|uniref:Uncharacterized protein n=1 Tax=Anaerosacchariphilus polymeriproducens TaxID=1812858 RepID=A0A371AW97_9FIRM|nr:hypothetical protein [Anaerosacchariphilus polymeriproducens]RDU23848.1 hypothetical protein DWV06_08295 [Anaerosacchariphilus polymeriproducens]